MDEFLKMDIFFVVATLCLIFLTALIGFAIWKLLKILKHVERIAQLAGKEAEHLQEDAAYLRGRLLGVLDALFGMIPRRRVQKEE